MLEPKDDEVKVRVTKSVKMALGRVADERGEAESVIVREAFALYLREHPEVKKPTDHPVKDVRPVNYRKKGPKPRLRVSEDV